MRELTICDFELVSGAVGPPGAVVGAVTGAATYIGGAMATGQGDIAGLTASAVAGGAAGFILGPAGMGVAQTTAASILGAEVGFYSGMLGGQVQSAVNAAGTNYGGTNYN
ncbi:hypothetical protein [Pseudomonas sp. GL-B-16]|uniref:hypothetical protein n=1 Tax=Pseudomonas sp. GL-B-16 TaxID=2832373 RepID=UPI001CBB1376|nr:hypothetical protein [Pseudomonas sp. GL-B-16]